MDEVATAWWTSHQQACPNCGGTGIPVVLEITDYDTKEALRDGLACLGECCYDGARGADRQCLSCGHEWFSGAPTVALID